MLREIDKKSLLCIVAIVALSAFMFFVGNGARSFIERDEPKFAQASREMLESGDYIVSRFNGEHYFTKPPLLFWLVTVAYRFLGVSEFSARFWPAIFGVATCLMFYFFVRFLFCGKIAFFSTLALISSPQMWIASKSCVTDSILLFSIVSALFSFYVIYKKGYSFFIHFWFYLSVAFSFFIKGPVGVLIIFLVIITFLIFTKKLFRLKDLKIVRGALLFLILVGPIAAVLYYRTQGLFFKVSIGEQFVLRCFETLNNHSGQLWYYLLALAYLFFPWIFFIPIIFRRYSKSYLKDDRVKFILIWSLFPLVAFTLLRTKLAHYILPIYPPLCIFIGIFFKESIDKVNFIGKSHWDKFFYGLYLIFSLLIGFKFYKFFYLKGFLDSNLLTCFFIIFLVALSLIAIFFIFKNDAKKCFFTILVGNLSSLIFINMFFLPSLNKYIISKSLAKVVNERFNKGDIKAVYGFSEPNLIFYLKGDVKIIKNENDLQILLSKFRKVYCIMPYELLRNSHNINNFVLISKEKGYDFEKKEWMNLCLISNKGGFNFIK